MLVESNLICTFVQERLTGKRTAIQVFEETKDKKVEVKAEGERERGGGMLICNLLFSDKRFGLGLGR